MTDENLTKTQLIDELTKLRQKNFELELALKEKESIYTASEEVSPSHWFSTGRAELVISKRLEQPPPLRPPLKYGFTDLVDISLLQQLLNSFYMATGIPHGLHDENNNILSGIGWQDICTRFHRVCPQSEDRCRQSDSYIYEHLHKGSYVGYKCKNGLMDFGTPIIIEGQHLASIFLGQFLHEPPDEEFFRCQAKEYGFDEAAYMEALRRVPIIPKEQVESIMDFFSQLGKIMVTMGLDRKRQLEATEKAVSEQKEWLRQIWETSNVGFWELNIDTGQLYYSPRWAEIFEHLVEDPELNIQVLKKYLHPKDITATFKAITQHLKGQTEKYEAEYRLLSKSGEWKWIMDRGQVVARNTEGKPLRIVGTSCDITDRKKTESTLFQTEQKFTKVFQCNPDPISITSLKERYFVEVNDAFLDITGHKRQDVIGRTAQELNIWVNSYERDEIIKLVQENGSIRNYETNFRMKSGEVRIFDVSVETIEIDGKEHIIVASRDLSARKQMEEDLRLSEECLFKAFNTSPIIMAITTLEEGRFIKANRAFDRILGYTHEEVIGQTSLEIGFWLNPADRCLVKQQIMAWQSVQDMEITFGNKTGEPRRGLYSAERLEIHGEICILSVLIDITELRQMQVEITRLDQLNLVGEMAASIGHEIRNPMTTVRGYLQILRENERYNQEVEYFDLMIEELDRANSIITEYLSLAKNKIVEMAPRNLNSIISKSLPLLQAKAISKDQYIKLELAEIPDLFLDNKEIRQLIINLVNNGLEAMSSHGEVTIKTFWEEEKVVLAVQDQGQGVEHSLLDKIGTPFLTTKEQGTGLGLAVCYRIAEQHNAKIDLDTSSNGTTFYVKFSPMTEELNRLA